MNHHHHHHHHHNHHNIYMYHIISLWDHRVGVFNISVGIGAEDPRKKYGFGGPSMWYQ